MGNILQEKIKLKASPVGELTTAFIDKPSTKFKKTGRFSADLAVEPDAIFPGTDGKTVQEMKEELEDFLDRFAEAAIEDKPKYKRYKDRRIPILEEYDDETDEPTGRLIIRAGQDAVIKLRKGGTRKMHVDLFNAKGQPMKGVAVGRGSKGRIAGTIKGYVSDANKQIGLTMYLEGCKILELVEPGVKGAESYGFDEEEEGYSETEGTTSSTAMDGDESVGLDDDDIDDDDTETADF